MAERGFTLIELIVVLAVMSLAIAAVPIVMSGGISGLQLKAAARDVANALRHARGRAIALNDEVVFSIDGDSGRYAVTPGERGGVLAEGTEVIVRPDATAGDVRFFPAKTVLARLRRTYRSNSLSSTKTLTVSRLTPSNAIASAVTGASNILK